MWIFVKLTFMAEIEFSTAAAAAGPPANVSKGSF